MARHVALPQHVEHGLHRVGRELGLDVRGNSEHRRIALNILGKTRGVPLQELSRQHERMHHGVTKAAGKPGRYGYAASPELGGGRRRGR